MASFPPLNPLLTWEPWEKFKPAQDALPIPEPPCKACANWKPVRVFEHGVYAGVRLCHAPEMHRDFSCWRPRNAS
jgi:hypothetical protein